MTSTTSPTPSASVAKPENAPPSSRLTATRSRPLVAGRADRVVAAHLVAVDLGAHREVLAGVEGVAVAQLVGHGEGDGDGVVGQPLDGLHRQRVEDAVPARRRAVTGASVTSERLEVVERLEAGVAGPQRLARRRAETATARGCPALPHCGQRTDSETQDGPARRACGAAAARCRSPAAPARPCVGHPVGRPRRRQHGADLDLGEARGPHGVLDVAADDVHRRAAGVGRGHGDDRPGRRRRRSTSRSTPRSAMVRTGTSGSSTAAGGGAGPRGRRRRRARSPGRSRVRAVQVLHLGQQVAERLGVDALPAAVRASSSRTGRSSVASASTASTYASHSGRKRRGVDGDAVGGQRPLEVVGGEQLVDVRATAAEARLHAAV